MTALLPVDNVTPYLPRPGSGFDTTTFEGVDAARRMRLLRLVGAGDGNLFVLPLDHSVTLGPVSSASGLNTLVRQASSSGVDAVVLHKGRVRWVDTTAFARMSLIIHLSASTRFGPDPSAKMLVTSVEEALRMGADAVSVHLNLGSADERRQLADVGLVAEACDRWNLPLMAMVYPPNGTNDPESVAHAATVAVELGCDVVKTSWTGSAASMADVVRSCPIPIVTAGGPRTPDADAVIDHVGEVMTSGARGVAMGRNVFEADCPEAMMRRVAAAVHPAPAPVQRMTEERTW
jgi:2-amino-4,5-dihydroxy-6-oxo-7-(phosphonooxy)heptanoate synthase